LDIFNRGEEVRTINNKRLLGNWVALLSITALLYAFPVHFAVAQEENPKMEAVQEGKASKSYELQTMTVTAQKQEENLQDIPMSISVYNGLSIEDMRIESVKDVADFTPNLMLFDNGQPGQNSPTMRGINATVDSFTVSTGLYVDGVPILMGSGFDTEMYDIERIEVLRGPQGTLYGKNTEAGAINVITKLPDNEFRGRVSGEIGEDNKRQGVVSLSGPVLQDKLFFSVSGRYYEKDGLITHADTGETTDDRRRWSGKAHLRWTPTDDLDISFIASLFQYDDEAININLTEMGYNAFGFSAPGYRQVSSNIDGRHESKNTSQALKITYDITDILSLTSVTAHRVWNDVLNQDFDFTPYTIGHTDKDGEYGIFSDELRLNISTDHFIWLVGLYYDNDRIEEFIDTISDYPEMQYTYDREINSDTYAAFTHISYSLSDKIRLLGGLRYEKSDYEFDEITTGHQVNESWDAITPKIAVEYHFTPSIMAYANVSEGYRSGGFNAYTQDPQYYSYDAETLWSYELGFKSSFLDNRAILNGAVFYMDISDMQVSEAVDYLEGYTTNAAEATSMGAELEITARVLEGLTLTAGFGYTDIEFDSFEDALGDYEGNKAPYAPDYTFNLGAQYRHRSGFYARADMAGYGEMYFDKDNMFSRDPYEIINARIGYEAGKFDIYLYAENLFDEEYDSEGYYGGYYVVYSEPREVGLQLVCRF
jgi:iron complex outermembrane receptor protein